MNSNKVPINRDNILDYIISLASVLDEQDASMRGFYIKKERDNWVEFQLETGVDDSNEKNGKTDGDESGISESGC